MHDVRSCIRIAPHSRFPPSCETRRPIFQDTRKPITKLPSQQKQLHDKMTTMFRLLIVTIAACIPTCAFTIHPTNGGSRILSSTRFVEAGDGPEHVENLFTSEAWGPIKKELNVIPIFVCASEEGLPLQYEVNSKSCSIFYCDIDAAKEELGKAAAETKMPGLDIVPFPLGDIFEKAAEGKAVMVPSAAAIVSAGAPNGTNPMGQQIPLFACMEIMQENEDGNPKLPLFMAYDEAQAAMEMALTVDGGDPTEFEVVGLSLQRAVELLATVPETPAFQFNPPASSVEHIRKYLTE